MNDMNVSRVPLRCSHAVLFLARRFATRVMSTSYTVCTCGEMRLDSTMRSAIFLRIGVIGTISPGISMGACDGAAARATDALAAGCELAAGGAATRAGC